MSAPSRSIRSAKRGQRLCRLALTVNNSDIQFLSQGQSLTEVYTVFVTDDHGASTPQDVPSRSTAPTTRRAPSARQVTDVGTGGVVDIPTWALALNDTDPDMLDTSRSTAFSTAQGGTAVPFGDAFFIDTTLAGPSPDVNDNFGAVSGNAATAVVVNNVLPPPR